MSRPDGTRGGARLAVLIALVAGLTGAAALRSVIGGPLAVQSPTAGLAFAGCLAALAAASGTTLTATRRDVLLGLAGAVVICLPAALHHALIRTPLPTASGFLGWVPVVAAVAAAEEVFLRGALFDAVRAVAGPVPAVGGSALAFGLLHVPLYGWRAVPLDLAVGAVLGLLRLRAGSATAPAIAHVAADFAGWFLR